MEFWEELDQVENNQELDDLHSKNQKIIQETVKKMSESFKNKDYKEAEKLTVELKYWYSLRDQILNKELNSSRKN